MSSIKIRAEDYVNHEETFGAVYRCPSCKDECLSTSFKFCPNCGVELDWDAAKMAVSDRVRLHDFPDVP